MHPFVMGIVCVLLALSFPGIDSRVVNKFTSCSEFFFKEKSPVIPGILEKSEAQTNGFKVICQKYKNKIRFATLYNTTGKIPVFSAYKYTGTNDFRRPNIPRTRMIELQLEPSSSDMKKPFENQARNEDYWINDKYSCSSRTLFPMIQTADRETANSTLTLTNTVPEKRDFRNVLWNQVENEIKDNMDNYCRDNNNRTVAYVLTGVIPGNETLNNKVNIPSVVWTAFCCYNSANTSWVSKTYNTINKYEKIPITLGSLEDLQTILRNEWGNKVELFNNNCK